MDDCLYKARYWSEEKAYTAGNTTQYRNLADKIITFIKRTKAEYYASKIESKRNQDPAKWHRSVCQLVGFEGVNSNNNEISEDSTTDAAEILQNLFTKSWLNLPETIIPSLEEVEQSLRGGNPPTTSIGVVKLAPKQLNPKKATGSDMIPGWVLKRYCEEHRLLRMILSVPVYNLM